MLHISHHSTVWYFSIVFFLNLVLHRPTMKNPTKRLNYYFISIQIFNTGCFVSIANHFGAPIVGITSTSLYPWFGGMVGDVVMPSYVPVNLLPFTSRMTFAERLINSVILIVMKTCYKFKYEQAVSTYHDGVVYYVQT